MKFLNVYCENRKASVYINLDRISLVTKLDESNSSLIELDGGKDPVKLLMPVDELIRKLMVKTKKQLGFAPADNYIFRLQ